MQIIREKISRDELANKYCTVFESMTKAVVDVGRAAVAVDAELHADLESCLLEDGSRQEDLWGINLYPGKPLFDFIEFTSLINIRPHQGNCAMNVESEGVRERIRSVVLQLVAYGTEAS